MENKRYFGSETFDISTVINEDNQRNLGEVFKNTSNIFGSLKDDNDKKKDTNKEILFTDISKGLFGNALPLFPQLTNNSQGISTSFNSRLNDQEKGGKDKDKEQPKLMFTPNNSQSQKIEETQSITSDKTNELKTKTKEAIEMPISNAKLDFNSQNEDLINDEVYCNKISKIINEWKKDLDEKYTFYTPFKEKIITYSLELEYLKDSANATAKIFNTIQSHIQQTSSSLTLVSNEQKDLIKQLKQLDEHLDKYNFAGKNSPNHQQSPKEEIRAVNKKLTNSIIDTGLMLDNIKKTSSKYNNKPSLAYKQIIPLSSVQPNYDIEKKKNDNNNDSRQSVKEMLYSIYKEIQSIQQIEQAIAFKLHSL